MCLTNVIATIYALPISIHKAGFLNEQDIHYYLYISTVEHSKIKSINLYKNHRYGKLN